LNESVLDRQATDIEGHHRELRQTHSHYVALCAAFSAIGGLIFGFGTKTPDLTRRLILMSMHPDQGVVSVLLVLPQFRKVFGRIDQSGFWKGLLTAMIELGALFGALNQGWIADKYSRKYSIVIAVCVFTVGSILQTAANDYTTLVVARSVRLL